MCLLFAALLSPFCFQIVRARKFSVGSTLDRSTVAVHPRTRWIPEFGSDSLQFRVIKVEVFVPRIDRENFSEFSTIYYVTKYTIEALAYLLCAGKKNV